MRSIPSSQILDRQSGTPGSQGKPIHTPTFTVNLFYTAYHGGYLSSSHLTHKVCPGCGIDKQRDEYYIRSNGVIMHRCKPCHLARHREWYEKNREKDIATSAQWRKDNPEKYREQMRKWKRENPERKRELEHIRRTRKLENGVFEVSPKDKRRLLGPCAYCGSTEQITVDHVIPIFRGGTHGIGNLVPCCFQCNMVKNARTVMEWRMSKSSRKPRLTA